MSDWKCYQLKNLGVIKTGKTPPSSCKDAFSNTGVPFVTPKDMNGVKTIFKTERYLSKIGLDSVKNYLVPKNSIAVSCIGSDMGKAYLLSEDSVTNQQINTLIVNKNHNFEFIYYKLSIMQDYLKSIAGGSATPILNKSHFSEIEIELPDLDTQNNFVEKLKYLDKKIQLNTQINQTLEQIAQALFKSWFVDFDPVRAKVQALSDGLSLEQAELAAMQAISGKTPEELTALSQTQPDRYAELAETAKAFPCEMVEVDGVEVPKGWRIGTFTDITESRREKVKNDKAMVLSAVSSGELVKSEEYFTKQVFSKSIDKYLKVYKWDFAYNPARINIGSIGLHEADYLGAVSPVYEVFSVSDKYHWFLKRILNLETTKIKIQSLCTGSVRQTLKLKDFQSIDCVIPDEKTLSIFNKKWEEYRTLILENNKNTQTLSEIRDLLLPRLLSGKIEND